eukprot:14708367-Alexandrium_andersonii.AAC.1
MLDGQAVGAEEFVSLHGYLASLQWSMRSEPAMSWVELAVDFALTTSALHLFARGITSGVPTI